MSAASRDGQGCQDGGHRGKHAFAAVRYVGGQARQVVLRFSVRSAVSPPGFAIFFFLCYFFRASFSLLYLWYYLPVHVCLVSRGTSAVGGVEGGENVPTLVHACDLLR